MYELNADFSVCSGPIKDMNSVNNGPILGARGIGNLDSYRAARIPFARTHDASFCYAYGGSHTVDIIAIFPDFDADENDPASYDFHLTDEYLDTIEAAGTRVFYRLGNKIEHESKRYGSIPPKDFGKWARICEHLIRHETEGWANGYHRDMPYWEIWNEPELNPQCWEGSRESFYEFYDVAARHLKACFPHLRIGGPASCALRSAHRPGCSLFLENFFKYITRDPADPAPLDFFSFHLYTTDPHRIAQDARLARGLLDEYGYTETETVLDEWNYVRAWTPAEAMIYGYRVIPSLKGAAFTAACMAEGQKSPLDHLMYYDARGYASWNGFWDPIDQHTRKPYYALFAFAELAALGFESPISADGEGVYALAARNKAGTEGAVLVTRYADDDSLDGKGTPAEKVRLSWSGLNAPAGVEVICRALDGEHDLSVVSGETVCTQNGFRVSELPLYGTLYIRFRAI